MFMQNTFCDYVLSLLKTIPRKIILALVLMILLSFTEGIGLMLLLPILQLIGLGTNEGSTGRLAQLISSFFRIINIHPTLISVLSVYVIIITAQALLNQWHSITNLSIEHGFALRLREKLYKSITQMNWLSFSRARSSDFTHALTTELDRVGGGTYFLLNLIVNVITAAVYILLALQLSIVITILVFACGLVLLLLLKRKFKWAHLSGEELSIESSSLYAACIEHFGSMKTTKSYGAEERNSDIFTKTARQVAAINIKLICNQAGIKYIFDIGTVIVLSLFLYISYDG